MPKYSVEWAKTYMAAGTVYIEADSPKQAEEVVANQIGEYLGDMNYQPEMDYVSACATSEEEFAKAEE